jgi:hypothetical protein
MFVESYGEAAIEAVGRMARNLSGAEACVITVLHAPAFPKLACTLSGFADGGIQVRTDLWLSSGMLVQVSVGQAMVVFGTVQREAVVEGAEPDLVYDIAVTSAMVRYAAAS